jgi:hypothetical protein
MKKMKTRYKILIIIGVIIILIITFFNLENIRYMLSLKYEYEREENSIFGKINIEGVIYEEITKDSFNKIYTYLENEGMESYEDKIIGKIDYVDIDIWKYWVYGRRDMDDRILLKGRDSYDFHDANYPELYFCRQDILHSIQDATKD